MRLLKNGVLISLSLISTLLRSQSETQNWHFGRYASVSFSTTPPVSMSTSTMFTWEGCASISDASGNLLMYTDGTKIWDQNHNVMPNGNGLLGNGSPFTTQAAIILKKPASTNIYYVFTLAANNGTNGLRTNEVDMSLASTGSVTTKNAFLSAGLCEGMTAVNHCNGQDKWLVVRDVNFGFRSYLLTPNGVSSTPVNSTFQPMPYNGNYGFALKISPNGEKLAAAITSFTNQTAAGFELYDFDNSSGIISNRMLLHNTFEAYSVEFSQDGTKLYGTAIPTNKPNQYLYQWDLCADSASAVAASVYTVSSSARIKAGLQLAADGKIYVAINASSSSGSLGIVNAPNNTGSACSYSDSSVAITTGTVLLGLPNFNSSLFFKNTKPVFNFSLSCKDASFFPRASTICFPAIISTTWDFGEPSSGIANTSTLTTPVHQYANNGTYTVTLIRQYKCFSDTIMSTITISGCVGNSFQKKFISLNIRPNPSKEKIEVGPFSSSSELACYIYDLQGKLVYMRYLKVEKGILNIDHNLNSGIYLLKVSESDRVVFKHKMIVEKD